MWLAFGQIVLAVMLVFLIVGTLVNLSRHPHWFIRGWDFPRMQICVLAVLLAALFAILEWAAGNRWERYDRMLLGATALMVLWQVSYIFAYTPLAPCQVIKTRREQQRQSFRVVISNVQLENTQYELWMQVMSDADPDVLLAVEVDQLWLDAIRPLRERYRIEVAQPQDNYYGMLLLSRLELRDTRVRFIVQDDIPSIHTTLLLPSGQEVRFCGVHPRPPEPLRDESSSHRDAELVVIARELADERRPSVIGGDLNDVAWSYTTRLFLKLGELLDPRRGRGFYNTFHARHRFFRFPLDHVFHSRCFSLRGLQRMDYVGSDHFPMLIDLQYEPEVASEQPEIEKDAADEQVGQEIIDQEEAEEHTRLKSHKRREEGGESAQVVQY